jgi:hypothetical protein
VIVPTASMTAWLIVTADDSASIIVQPSENHDHDDPWPVDLPSGCCIRCRSSLARRVVDDSFHWDCVYSRSAAFKFTGKVNLPILTATS